MPLHEPSRADALNLTIIYICNLRRIRFECFIGKGMSPNDENCKTLQLMWMRRIQVIISSV